MPKNIVIAGGGIAGLLSAYFLALRNSDSNITLIEKSGELGGLHRTFTYDSGLLFDCGMHFWTETGLDDLDSHMRSLLPADEWISLTGVNRDRSGIFFNGTVQSNSQYPDLRRCSDEEYSRFITDFFKTLNRNSVRKEMPAPTSFGEYAVEQFGEAIAHSIVIPIAEKVHGHPASDLHPMAKALPLLDRVILFDEPLQLKLMQSDMLRDRLAFPEQTRLPLTYSSGLSSLYPKKYGIYRIIDALREKLITLGVTVMTSSVVSALRVEKERVVEATINTNGAESYIKDVEKIVWANLCVSLAPLLGIDLRQFETDPVSKTVLVNILCSSPPEMGQLYCLFNGDCEHKSYRITDYSSYCPDAIQDGQFPVSVELLMRPDAIMNKGELLQLATSELRSMGVIKNDVEPAFSAVEVLPSGFPSVTRKNINVIDCIRERVGPGQYENIDLVGILAKPNMFFQKDVLIDVYHRFGEA